MHKIKQTTKNLHRTFRQGVDDVHGHHPLLQQHPILLLSHHSNLFVFLNFLDNFIFISYNIFCTSIFFIFLWITELFISTVYFFSILFASNKRAKCCLCNVKPFHDLFHFGKSIAWFGAMKWNLVAIIN